MTRVLSSACVVLLVLGLGGRAWAGGKLPIAILGLEVYDNGSGIDPETTRAAKDLTAALRDRAKAGTGPYTPVQGGEKELIDEKLLNNCDSEAASCMAAIGADLGAEVLMYGKIEKAVQNGEAIYRVSLRLLNVNRKQLASSTVETLPVDAAAGVKISTYAKTWYAKLAGVVSGGTLVVKANIDRGTVLLDGAPKGNLASGTLTLAAVPEGRHTLAIEAKDVQRYEVQVTVRTGETTTQNATMVEMSKKVTPGPGERLSTEGTVGATAKPKTSLWKPVFYGTLVLTAGGVGWSLFAADRSSKAGDKIEAPDISQENCGLPSQLNTADQKNFDSACRWHKRQIFGWVATGVVGTAAIASFVMAYLRDGSSSETSTASRGRRKRRELVVTPIVTSQGGGATLRFDW